MNDNPTIWQMIKEAATQMGKCTPQQIRDYIRKKYGHGKKESSINAHLKSLCVNDRQRIHFTKNKKPRLANGTYDILFKLPNGEFERYDPEKHGIWEIRQNDDGKLVVAQVDKGQPVVSPGGTPEELDEAPPIEEEQQFSFAVESHLRDFLARNIEKVALGDSGLKVYVDQEGREGVEYPTEVGPIDILATDKTGNFVVLELKLSRGPDRALGQLLRYMGWVKKKLAGNKSVKGVVVASTIDEKLRYAASMVPGTSLFRYQLDFKIEPVNEEAEPAYEGGS